MDSSERRLAWAIYFLVFVSTVAFFILMAYNTVQHNNRMARLQDQTEQSNDRIDEVLEDWVDELQLSRNRTP